MVGRPRSCSDRPALTFVAWGAVGGRSTEIAAALGGEPLTLFPPVAGRRRSTFVRYVLSSAATAVHLVRARPRAVIVTNPPIFPALIVWLYAGLRGRAKVAVVLDSHPGAFGLQGDALGSRMIPLHRFLARRARAVMVTSPELAEVVGGWGGRGIIVHEAPGDWAPVAPRPPAERPRVLVVSRFAQDEPSDVVVDAAARLPGCDFSVTGRLEDLPADLARRAPGNVRFVGFMGPEAYHRAVEDADVIVTLTTEPASVMRAAYEAVYAEKVLVLSDWPLSRRLFPAAVPVDNTDVALAEGISTAIAQHDHLARAAGSARMTQVERWDRQLCELRQALGGVPAET